MSSLGARKLKPTKIIIDSPRSVSSSNIEIERDRYKKALEEIDSYTTDSTINRIIDEALK